MSQTHDTIARLLNQAGEHLKNGIARPIDAAMNCIHQAFLETIGPALAEADRAEAEQPAEDLSATLRREECERKSARQAKPAGWIVRYIGGPLRWLCRGPAGYEPYATREDAQRIADTTGGEPVPVDAAGNVIEAGGIAWEAARSYEEAERLRAELDAALTERADLRIALRAVAADRDHLTADVADLRYALRQIAGLVGGAIALGASTETHCALANEVRLVVERLKREEALSREGERIAVAERDRLAAELQQAREQKPVRWAVVLGGLITSVWHDKATAEEVCTTLADRAIAPLYLAPVPARDHSAVIAQCEEALREWDTKGAHCHATSALVAVTLTKARNALRGAP